MTGLFIGLSLGIERARHLATNRLADRLRSDGKVRGHTGKGMEGERIRFRDLVDFTSSIKNRRNVVRQASLATCRAAHTAPYAMGVVSKDVVHDDTFMV